MGAERPVDVGLLQPLYLKWDDYHLLAGEVESIDKERLVGVDRIHSLKYFDRSASKTFVLGVFYMQKNKKSPKR